MGYGFFGDIFHSAIFMFYGNFISWGNIEPFWLKLMIQTWLSLLIVEDPEVGQVLFLRDR